MTKATIDGRAAATMLFVLVAIAAGCRSPEREFGDAGATSAGASSSSVALATSHPSFLHGRITTVGGDTYEGRLRFGGDQEAFWGDYFNGFKDGNPWVDQVPEGLPADRPLIEILGVEIGSQPGMDLSRQVLARFGDIARIEARGRDLRVTLKSGTEYHLDRYAADDFADGLRVWDARHGIVDLDEGRVRTIEFLLLAGPGAAPPHRLHGTVRTRGGDFTGFLQWNRHGSIGQDELEGRAADGQLLRLPFAAIRSIARRSRESCRVTLHDGREIVLSDTRDVGEGNGGVYVDDLRYGRVLISWEAFDQVDFSAVGPGGSGPAYDDFPTGGPLTGTVTTRAGRRLAGRLVYDLDESEITETLDAPSRGVDYTIAFGLVASIVLRGGEERARVTLQSGEQLQLERIGDLGAGNAGMLIFVDGREHPEYVPWTDVERIDFDRPPAMYPPVSGR